MFEPYSHEGYGSEDLYMCEIQPGIVVVGNNMKTPAYYTAAALRDILSRRKEYGLSSAVVNGKKSMLLPGPKNARCGKARVWLDAPFETLSVGMSVCPSVCLSVCLSV